MSPINMNKVRAWYWRACLLAIVMAANGAAAGAAGRAVTVKAGTIPWKFTDEKGENVREADVQQVVLENEYLRALIVPSLGGRIARVFDKTANADVFQRVEQPIKWNVERRFSAYNSQLGGIIVNFPCFHHGNSFSDNWNWRVEEGDDGSATVIMAWTDEFLRQRVMHRVTMRPGNSALTSGYRYANLNPFAMGFAPWINTLFPTREDLQWIIPSPYVAPHGFNAGTLAVLPWPWPDADTDSVCFWRNAVREPYARRYGSVFAVDVQRGFSGFYYHELDRGLARLFDRREQRGVKLFHAPAFFEQWSSPALVHEDALWWEGYGVRRYEDVWMPVHGIGGYREANVHGALNLVRGDGRIEVGVFMAHPVPDAVVSLSGIDGIWWRVAVGLSPDKPLRQTVRREPGRMPLELKVTDAAGRVLIRLDGKPDPGLRHEVKFAGTSLWKTDELREALRAEQYYPLWRGGTGGYQPLAGNGAKRYRKLLGKAPDLVDARLGLARSLMVDAQLRGPDRPGCGTAEQVAAFQEKQLTEALEVLAPVLKDPAAARLAGEVKWRQGDAKASAGLFEATGDDAVAQLGLARALAALGKQQRAAKPAKRAAQLLPASAPAAQLAAGIALLRGKPREALDGLRVIHQKDPLDPVTLTLLAMAHRGAGDARQAAALETQVKELQAQTNEPVDLAEELRRLGLGALAGP